MPATELKTELNVPARVEAICCKLGDKSLNACRLRKMPLLSSKHVAKRLSCAKADVNYTKEK